MRAAADMLRKAEAGRVSSWPSAKVGRRPAIDATGSDDRCPPLLFRGLAYGLLFSVILWTLTYLFFSWLLR